MLNEQVKLNRHLPGSPLFAGSASRFLLPFPRSWSFPRLWSASRPGLLFCLFRCNHFRRCCRFLHFSLLWLLWPIFFDSFLFILVILFIFFLLFVFLSIPWRRSFSFLSRLRPRLFRPFPLAWSRPSSPFSRPRPSSISWSGPPFSIPWSEWPN